MKKVMNERSCLLCGDKQEIFIEVETKPKKVCLCKKCCENLYRQIGKKIVPTSPLNLFQNRK